MQAETQLDSLRQQLEAAVREKEGLEKQLQQQSASQEERQRWVGHRKSCDCHV